MVSNEKPLTQRNQALFGAGFSLTFGFGSMEAFGFRGIPLSEQELVRWGRCFGEFGV